MAATPVTLVKILAAAIDDLRERGREPALVGGLAVSARTEPRFTRDVDLAISTVDDAETEALIGSLVGQGYAVKAVVEQRATARLATVRLVAPGPRAEAAILDLLFASSGIEPEIVAAARPEKVFPGLDVRVATVGHLIALKVLARDDRRRPQDAADLRALLVVANADELVRAREALFLIRARGYHRGRALQTRLKRARREFVQPLEWLTERSGRPKARAEERRGHSKCLGCQGAASGFTSHRWPVLASGLSVMETRRSNRGCLPCPPPRRATFLRP